MALVKLFYAELQTLLSSNSKVSYNNQRLVKTNENQYIYANIKYYLALEGISYEAFKKSRQRDHKKLNLDPTSKEAIRKNLKANRDEFIISHHKETGKGAPAIARAYTEYIAQLNANNPDQEPIKAVSEKTVGNVLRKNNLSCYTRSKSPKE